MKYDGEEGGAPPEGGGDGGDGGDKPAEGGSQ